MREIVVISGKGGTGKTSMLASFSVLAQNAVIADCDVDAADLHLILQPEIIERHVFQSGCEAVINKDICTSCGACFNLCRFDAIKESWDENGTPLLDIDPLSCEGCGVCARFCPKDAIEFLPRICGEWMVSKTRCGSMVHAQLGIAAENSGKLVALVRQKAQELAEKEGKDLILIDGPPGIGCPAIASIGGVSEALVVTEPTLSGAHDLERVLSLTKHFNVATSVCVNKWDINPAMTEKIEEIASAAGANKAGRIRYDKAVTEAQIQGKSAIETNALCAGDIREIWDRIMKHHP